MRFTVQSYPLYKITDKTNEDGWAVSIDGKIFKYREKAISEKEAVKRALNEFLR